MTTNTESQTPIDDQIFILGQFWDEYSEQDEFFRFFDSHEPSLATAYGTFAGLATPTEVGKRIIHNTWLDLLEFLKTEDTGFSNIKELITESGIELG